VNLYILRHGIAMEKEDWNGDDSTRPLTREGEKQLAKISKALRKMDFAFDLILSSPFERARKTAEIVAEELHWETRVKFSGDLTPEGDPENVIAEIRNLIPQPENALLVGHEPYLSKLISQLICEGDAEIEFKKAGLCKLKSDALRFGRCAKLCWLLTPKQMELMS
jgi:phosphohistidine phosphatase